MEAKGVLMMLFGLLIFAMVLSAVYRMTVSDVVNINKEYNATDGTYYGDRGMGNYGVMLGTVLGLVIIGSVVFLVMRDVGIGK